MQTKSFGTILFTPGISPVGSSASGQMAGRSGFRGGWERGCTARKTAPVGILSIWSLAYHPCR